MPNGQCPLGTTPYVVRPNDTFYSIAKFYNLSLDELLRLNPDVDPDNLQTGQVICLPMTNPRKTCPEGQVPYFVRAGDTFYSLADFFGTTVPAIQAANPGVDPNNLQIDQQLCIPTPYVTCGSCCSPYRIHLGDTYYNLAKRYGTTVEAIAAANPGVDPNNLQVGQIICIPVKNQCKEGFHAYIIQAGDTLYFLSLRFGTTVGAIFYSNPGIDASNLQIGSVICIPYAGVMAVKADKKTSRK